MHFAAFKHEIKHSTKKKQHMECVYTKGMVPKAMCSWKPRVVLAKATNIHGNVCMNACVWISERA